MEKMNREAKLSFVGQRDEVPDLCNRVDSPATLLVFQPVRTETVSGSAALERGSRSAWACHCSCSLNVHAQSAFAHFLSSLATLLLDQGCPMKEGLPTRQEWESPWKEFRQLLLEADAESGC